MQTKLEKSQMVYEKVLTIMERNQDLFGDVYSDLIDLSNRELLKIELNEKFGYSIPNGWYDTKYIPISSYANIVTYDGTRCISAEDNFKQPYNNEMLYVIRFNSGPYTLGKNYNKPLFTDMFNELKEFGFEYCDSINNTIYFSLKTGAKVELELKNILKKYRALYVEIEKNKDKSEKIKELKKKLAELENN